MADEFYAIGDPIADTPTEQAPPPPAEWSGVPDAHDPADEQPEPADLPI